MGVTYIHSNGSPFARQALAKTRSHDNEDSTKVSMDTRNQQALFPREQTLGFTRSILYNGYSKPKQKLSGVDSIRSSRSYKGEFIRESNPLFSRKHL
jgi:hypothetical protein